MEKNDSNEIKKMVAVSILIMLLVCIGIKLAYNFYGDNFILLVVISSPFIMIFGLMILSAVAESKKEVDKQKRIDDLESRIKEIEKRNE